MGQKPAHNNKLAGRAGRAGVSSSTVLFIMYSLHSYARETLQTPTSVRCYTQVFLESPRETFSLYSLLADALTSSWRKIKNISRVS